MRFSSVLNVYLGLATFVQRPTNQTPLKMYGMGNCGSSTWQTRDSRACVRLRLDYV